METVLRIENLSKSYPGVRALQQLNLQVEGGSIYGLLGPNGSGKTTTLGIVLDVLRADQGRFTWFEQSLSRQTKRRIGAILETPNFYPYLSARQNLKIAADIKQAAPREIDRVLEMVGLQDRQQAAFKEFSLGMKQRLALGSALLGNPEVLVLDEPTNGLDPQGIAEVRHLIRQLGSAGKTIILASHLLDEVQKVCTHVAVLQKGHLRIAGPVEAILARHDQVWIETAQLQQAADYLRQLAWVQELKREDAGLLLSLQEGYSTAQLNQALFEQGIVLSVLSVRKKTLESHFLDITQDQNKPL